jgi:hypothetical protein
MHSGVRLFVTIFSVSLFWSMPIRAMPVTKRSVCSVEKDNKIVQNAIVISPNSKSLMINIPVGTGQTRNIELFNEGGILVVADHGDADPGPKAISYVRGVEFTQQIFVGSSTITVHCESEITNLL